MNDPGPRPPDGAATTVSDDAVYAFDFEGRVEWHAIGRTKVLTYRAVFLPDDLAGRLPLGRQGAVRVEGELGEFPFEAAWQPAGNGRHFMMVGPALLREAGLDVGDEVRVRFTPIPADRVTVPPELTRLLAVDAEAAEAWTALTPGKRRAWAHFVGSAKSEATRTRRTEEVRRALHEGRDPGPPRRR